MSAWVEGLLGAVMGGAQEYGNVLKEEEAAKRKEEEEKRREERAISLKEREAKMKQDMERKLEEEKQKRVASYMAPQEQTVLSQSPDDPEGMIRTEMKGGDLNEGVKRAIAAGDLESAKKLSDELNKEIRRNIDLSREGRELESQEARLNAPERPTASMRNFEARVLAAYPGPKDEDGNPLDPDKFEEFRRQAAKTRLFGRERQPSAGPAGQRPLTAGQWQEGETKLRAALKDAFTTTVDGKKQFNAPLFEKAQQLLVPALQDADKTKPLDINRLESEIKQKVSAAERQARADAGKAWDAIPEKERKARKNTYIDNNYLSYIDAYLFGGGQSAQAAQPGKPWTRFGK